MWVALILGPRYRTVYKGMGLVSMNLCHSASWLDAMWPVASCFCHCTSAATLGYILKLWFRISLLSFLSFVPPFSPSPPSLPLWGVWLQHWNEARWRPSKDWLLIHSNPKIQLESRAFHCPAVPRQSPWMQSYLMQCSRCSFSLHQVSSQLQVHKNVLRFWL